MSVRPATVARIEGAHRFSAFYRGGLANHLPMALVALDAMGAQNAAWVAYFERRIRAYAATGNFTLLHGVTACHAARLLARFARDRDAALRRLWAALVAAYMGEGCPAPGGWALAGSDASAQVCPAPAEMEAC
jgi:hypothetical protein